MTAFQDGDYGLEENDVESCLFSNCLVCTEKEKFPFIPFDFYGGPDGTPAFADSIFGPAGSGEFLGGGTTPNTGGRRNRGLAKEKGRKLDKEAGGKAEGVKGGKKNKIRCVSYEEAYDEGLHCLRPYYGCG